MKRVIVLSNEEQYGKAAKNGCLGSDCQILCDNERFFDFLKQRKVAFLELSEFDLQDHWDEINTWGWEKAGGFIRMARQNHSFPDVDLPPVIFLWLTVILILVLKNFIRAQKIIGMYQPNELIIFKCDGVFHWPEYSGNVFLNHFLEEQACRASIKTFIIESSSPRQAVLPDTSSKLKRMLRRLAKKVIHGIYGFFVQPSPTVDSLVYGTLRHLASSAIELRTQGRIVVFYDDEFRTNHFLFCRKNNITYLLPSCFRKRAYHTRDFFIEKIKKTLEAFLRLPSFQEHFSYKSFNLSEFVKSILLNGSLDAQLLKLADQANLFENIVNQCRIKSLLLDEDFNAHAFFASFMKGKGVDVFCISHANMALDCKVSGTASFDQSYTFVQGQHEKDTYIEKGWAPDRIMVTGIPRYDRLIDMVMKREGANPQNNPINILYCAGLLWPFSPDVLGFIGCDVFGFRNSQEKAVKMLLAAVRDLNVTVTIKPHYAEDEAMWIELVKQEQAGDVAKVVKASEDYFGLLLESDAMALCLWSSTLIEAGIAGVPVYYLDLQGQNSSQVKRLQRSGLCEIISDFATFRNAIKKLSRSTRERKRNNSTSPEMAHYLGLMDGQATARVTKFIQEKIRGESHVAI